MRNAAILLAAAMLFTNACSTNLPSRSDAAKSPATENANVVIYRPREPAEISGVAYTLYVNGKDMGRLRSQRFLKLRLAPGRHVFDSSAADSRPITIDVQENPVWIEAQVATAPKYGLLLTPVSMKHATQQLPALALK